MQWIGNKHVIVLLSGLVLMGTGLSPVEAQTRSGPTPPIPRSVGYTTAFEKIHTQPASKSTAIIKDLQSKMADMPPPYIFELARRTYDTDPKEALILFWLATLRAHTDAEKCSDISVLQGLKHWNRLVPRILKILKAYPQSSQRAQLIAIERDKAFLTDTSPRWICFSGKAAARAKAENRDYEFWHKPTREWRALRKQTRQNMIKSANRALK